MDVCSIALTILYVFVHFPLVSKLLCSSFTLTDTVNLQKVGRMLMHTHCDSSLYVISTCFFNITHVDVDIKVHWFSASPINLRMHG